MSITTFDAALEFVRENAGALTVEQLKSLAVGLSGDLIDPLPAGGTYLLYSGALTDGVTYASDLAAQVEKSGSAVSVTLSHVGQFVDNPEFQNELFNAYMRENNNDYVKARIAFEKLLNGVQFDGFSNSPRILIFPTKSGH